METACGPERSTPVLALSGYACRSFGTGGFQRKYLVRYQRSEQAFVLALMEMVLNGISTRKVTKVTEELCGAHFSKSTASQLCSALDARVRAFNERPLGSFPFLIIDAMY